MRRMKRITHSQLKFYFLQTTKGYYKKRSIRLYTFLIIHVFLNKKVYRRITKDIKNKKHIVLLATAAPDCYAKKIAEDLRFDACIATSGIDAVDWKENFKETKLKNVMYYIDKMYNTKNIGEIYTDHEDDFSLIKKAKKVFLVNPNRSLIEILEKSKIAFSIISKK